MNMIYCEKVGKPELKDTCKDWYRTEGICCDCPSYDSCGVYAEKCKREESDG